LAIALGLGLAACSDDPSASPGTTTTAPISPSADRSTDRAAPTTSVELGSASTVAPTAPAAPSSTIGATSLPDRCTARQAPLYPNPATERWVPSPETADVVDDFATLVLGWPDVQVVNERADGPVTLVRITSGPASPPVEVVVVPGSDGEAVAVCGAKSVVQGEWSASVLVEGLEVVSGFGIRSDDGTQAAVHEVFPDVVSAQLLISHGPHVQQVAANDPEKGWTFQLDHPTVEPGWQLAFWRDADGAALAVMDTDLPAGDFTAG
jgi:hypothetical protein